MGFFRFTHPSHNNNENDLDDDIKEFNNLFDNLSFDDLDTEKSEDTPSFEPNGDLPTHLTPFQTSDEDMNDPSCHHPEVSVTERLGGENISYDDSEDLLHIEPNLAVVWNNKGVVLSRLGRYAESLEAFDQALRLNPEYTNAWNNKGVALSKQGRFEKAIEAYDQALKIYPGYQSLSENKTIIKSEAPAPV